MAQSNTGSLEVRGLSKEVAIRPPVDASAISFLDVMPAEPRRC